MTKEMVLDEAVGTIQYPCLVISGLIYQAEFEFFRDLKSGNECNLPLYVDLDGEYIKLSDVSLTHRLLLALNQISNGSYGLELMENSNESVTVDYMNLDLVLQTLKVW